MSDPSQNDPTATDKNPAEITSRRYAVFLENYRHTAEAKLKAHEQLDSYLLKFSAGALALSLSPTTGLFETSDTAPRCLLVLAWLLYLVTIGTTLYSFRESAKSCDKMVNIAFQAIVEGDEGATERHKKAVKSTRTLNILAIWSFLAAMLLSVIYLAVTFLA